MAAASAWSSARRASPRKPALASSFATSARAYARESGADLAGRRQCHAQSPQCGVAPAALAFLACRHAGLGEVRRFGAYRSSWPLSRRARARGRARPACRSARMRRQWHRARCSSAPNRVGDPAGDRFGRLHAAAAAEDRSRRLSRATSAKPLADRLPRFSRPRLRFVGGPLRLRDCRSRAQLSPSQPVRSPSPPAR